MVSLAAPVAAVLRQVAVVMATAVPEQVTKAMRVPIVFSVLMRAVAVAVVRDQWALPQQLMQAQLAVMGLPHQSMGLPSQGPAVAEAAPGLITHPRMDLAALVAVDAAATTRHWQLRER